jgi:MoaA/NifB/PqqE/SkfB family radical SAM enzyme
MSAPRPPPEPQRYFEVPEDGLAPVVDRPPVCLYLEVTNRCNLLCTTCPRTYEELEPPGDMSFELFARIVDQVPDLARAVLHGVGEPLLVRDLARMIRHLKARGTYVLFNTNGTLLDARRGRELVEAGLDELRVSLDAAEPGAFALVRGVDAFERIVANVKAFTALQRELSAARPRVSLWLTGLKETLAQLPRFVELAHAMDVPEVHLQRLVYFPEGQGLARPESALFERLDGEERGILGRAEETARALGITFSASGAVEPELSVSRAPGPRPWSRCRRPWTLMYFTATGRALPCCIAPFSLRGYEHYTLGDARHEPLADIWNGPRYQAFRRALAGDDPPAACASCGLRWSL